jgi:hypothetical protein
MAESIFRKESMEQISSPEQLNDYIRVSNPGIWIVLAAIIVFLGAGAFWAASAAIPTTVSTQALVESPGRYVCYLPLDTGVKAGMNVQVAGAEGRVSMVGETPLSYAEAAGTLPNDYTAYALGITDWNIRVEILLATDLPMADSAGTLRPVSIITDIVRPLSFLFN